jgi:hypothetical protein
MKTKECMSEGNSRPKLESGGAKKTKIFEQTCFVKVFGPTTTLVTPLLLSITWM